MVNKACETRVYVGVTFSCTCCTTVSKCQPEATRAKRFVSKNYAGLKILESKIQKKPFWLATQRCPQNDWTGRHVNHEAFAKDHCKSIAFSDRAFLGKFFKLLVSSEVSAKIPGPWLSLPFVGWWRAEGLRETTSPHLSTLPSWIFFFSSLSTALLVLDRHRVGSADHVNHFIFSLKLWSSIKVQSLTHVGQKLRRSTALLSLRFCRTSETVQDEDSCVAVAGGFDHAGGRVDVNWRTALHSHVLAWSRRVPVLHGHRCWGVVVYCR